jgi:CDP-glycerol glycerophosphotransferase
MLIKDRLRKLLPLSLWNKLIIFKVNVKSIKYYLLRVFPVKSNKIVIVNYEGKGFGDNGKYIAQELLKNSDKYEIVWLANKNVAENEFPKDIRVVEYGTNKAIYELVTAKIWIDNCRKTADVRKRKVQYYINTGHGGIPLKKVEKDAEDKLSYSYILKAKNDSKMLNLMTSNSKFRSKILKESYWYEGEVIECGSPKIEVLMLPNSDTIRKVKKHYKLDNEIQILLYAPTFRSENSLKYYDIDFVRLKRRLEKYFGGRWEILFRLHPNLSNQINEIRDKEAFIDATLYPDMQELLIASDVLVTDYSGTMFEYIYKNKPVFLYAKDIKSYDRGFYFDFSELPFPLATNNEELETIISNFNHDDYYSKVKEFKLKVGLIEQFGASKKIGAIIDEIIRGGKHNSLL